jgi:hypothetical protein
MAGYELSEAAVRKLAEIVRAYSAGKLTARTAPPASPRRDAPYTPEFYRLAVNAGDGAYTLRKQEWDADTDEMINLADGFDPDYNLDIDGFDYQGRADGVAGAAGTGQIVRGWRLFIDDAWVTLIDVGDAMDKTFYAYLVTACGYWIAVNKNGHVLGTCYFVSGIGWEWDSPSEWGIPHPAVAPEPTWTPGTWL